MPGLVPVIGGTEKEAQEKYDFIQSLTHPKIIWQIVSQHYQGRDFTGYSLDDPAPSLPNDTNFNKSRLKLVSADVERERQQLRQAYRTPATPPGHHVVVGTPKPYPYTLKAGFKTGRR